VLPSLSTSAMPAALLGLAVAGGVRLICATTLALVLDDVVDDAAVVGVVALAAGAAVVVGVDALCCLE